MTEAALSGKMQVKAQAWEVCSQARQQKHQPVTALFSMAAEQDAEVEDEFAKEAAVSEHEELPTGVVMILTKCYSASCGDDSQPQKPGTLTFNLYNSFSRNTSANSTGAPPLSAYHPEPDQYLTTSPSIMERHLSEMLHDLASYTPYSLFELHNDAKAYWEVEVDETRFVNFSLLSNIAVQLRNKVLRGVTHVKGSIPYPHAFTSKDIVNTVQAQIQHELALNQGISTSDCRAALQVAPSLQSRLFFHEVEWGGPVFQDSSGSDAAPKREEFPTSVVTMLTKCYRASWGDEALCYLYGCPQQLISKESQECNRQLLEVMYVRQRKQAPVIQRIGNVFLSAAMEFRLAYPIYIRNHPLVEKHLKEEMGVNPEFQLFIEHCSRWSSWVGNTILVKEEQKLRSTSPDQGKMAYIKDLENIQN
ncbi:hypothetical protein K438DRAFT_1784078, partial [Mycena galopus ATCC 62051]